MENFLKKSFINKNGIISFEIKDIKTKEVSEFYNNNPFPNYKEGDNKQTILDKGNKNFLANQFKNFIGYKKKVLEVGCGTGQLSNYFAIGTNNKIVGLDPTITSLNLANDFANKNKLKISMLVISNESKFLKKAKGLIRFECDQVNTLKKTLSSLSKNKTTDKIKLKSTGYDESGDVVSEFIYEWSFKLKE